jgi:hypothetical protein
MGEPDDLSNLSMRTPTNSSVPAVAPVQPNRWRGVIDPFPGIALVGALAAIAIALGNIGWFESTGISALTLAIALGMIVGNTLYPRIAHAGASGVTFSKQTLLRLGIILYGLRLTFQDIATVGIPGVTIDFLVLSSTFVLSWWMGTRLFGLDRKTAMLIGAGSSICGAAAVMATEPVVRGRAEQLNRAVYLLFYQSISPACDVTLFLRHLCRLHHPRSRAGGCGWKIDQRWRRQYSGHNQDGAGHDAGSISRRTVRLLVAHHRSTPCT